MIGSSPIYNVRVQVKLALRAGLSARPSTEEQEGKTNVHSEGATRQRKPHNLSFGAVFGYAQRPSSYPMYPHDRFSLKYAYVLCDICAKPRHPPVCNQYPPSTRQAPSPID